MTSMEKAAATWNVMCPTCRGTGMAPAPTMYVDHDGNGSTAYTSKRCKDCAGEGWMPVNGKPQT